uniref:Uncharacterized protein n=1 Tax=Romanomermis culicivorax TaxID=13658 RepID=A0A915JF43_ROMCU
MGIGANWVYVNLAYADLVYDNLAKTIWRVDQFGCMYVVVSRLAKAVGILSRNGRKVDKEKAASLALWAALDGSWILRQDRTSKILGSAKVLELKNLAGLSAGGADEVAAFEVEADVNGTEVEVAAVVEVVEVTLEERS